MQPAPVREQRLERRDLALRERHGRGALARLLLARRLEEGARVVQRGEQGREVGGHDVRHKPWDRFRVQRHARREPGREQVPGQQQVGEQLEARVVEDDVDGAVAARGLRGEEHVVRAAQVVDEDVLLGGLARLGALQLLDVGVRERRQQREVRRVAPQADLGDLGEDEGGCLSGGRGA
ncbi:hypothetical protein V498_10503 [Pseudogymnoascus sp. VKM F-4517 (FW-2822)]|nr:hypothetical protein V498_10503 [Pseudogymnoascus sp. VKM F-4517 (FW-2822)]